MNKLTIPAATLALLASIGAHAATNPALLASTDSLGEAGRTVVIQPGTRYVNVTQDEVVKFVDNGQEFAVRFDGVRSSFDLRAVAPAGALDHKVVAYVAPDPTSED